jgi:hypothetical protein
VNPEVECKINAVAEELGVTEVKVFDAVKAAMADHTALFFMDPEEIAEVHDRIAFTLRMIGLKGAALDEAIAAAFREAARAIEHQRAVEWKRSKTMRLVQ